MPIGGVMTLADVVDAGQRGREQAFERDQMDRAQKQRGAYDLAGQRAQQAIEAERQQWVSGGGDPAKFRPSDTTMLKASEVFGQTLAENGDLQGYLKNEAAIQPHRLRIRQQAIQRYRMDGDKTKLLKTVYATIPDGQDIADVQEVSGGPAPSRGTNPTATPAAPPKTLQQGLADYENDLVNPMANPVSGANEAPIQPIQPGKPGDGRLGAPSGASKLRVKTSGGDVRDVDFDQFLAGVQQLQMDPMKEIELNYQRALSKVREDARAPNILLRGDQARQTQKQVATDRKAQGMQNFQNALSLADVNNKARKERVEIQQEGANERNDTRVAAVTSRAGGKGGANAVQSRSVDQDGYVVLNFKDGTSKRATVDGKPVRSQDWSKRVDAMVKNLQNSNAGMNKPVQQLRQEAEQMLMGKPPADPKAAKPNVQSTINRLLGD